MIFMNHQGSGGKTLDDEPVKNEADNTDFDEVNPLDDDGLSEKERKLKQLQEEERRKYKEEESRKTKSYYRSNC